MSMISGPEKRYSFWRWSNSESQYHSLQGPVEHRVIPLQRGEPSEVTPLSVLRGLILDPDFSLPMFGLAH